MYSEGKDKVYISETKGVLKMKSILAIFTILFAAHTALATGSTSCLVDNDEVSLEVNLINGNVFGNPIINGVVSVKIKKNQLAVGVAAYDFEFSKGEVPYWFNISDELKLGAYAEPEVDSSGNPLDFWTSMSVVLDLYYAVGTEGPGLYVGKYSITQSSSSVGPGSLTKTFEGAVTCKI